MVTTNCVNLRSTTLSLLRGNMNQTLVARYGNASILNRNDWISITENLPTLSSVRSASPSAA